MLNIDDVITFEGTSSDLEIMDEAAAAAAAEGEAAATAAVAAMAAGAGGGMQRGGDQRATVYRTYSDA